MSKVAVVFWSGTGNTQTMAEKVLEGAKEAGASAELFSVEDFSADKMDSYDAVAFGCPAMGDEVLEEDVFEPVFRECEAKLKDKKIGLFGSYGWGDGEWMRSWEKTCREDGALLAADCVICNEEPDEEGLQSCLNMGRALAEV